MPLGNFLHWAFPREAILFANLPAQQGVRIVVSLQLNHNSDGKWVSKASEAHKLNALLANIFLQLKCITKITELERLKLSMCLSALSAKETKTIIQAFFFFYLLNSVCNVRRNTGKK